MISLSCHSNSAPTCLPWATRHKEISVHMNGTTNMAVCSLLINLRSLLKLRQGLFRDGSCLELTSWILWSQLFFCFQDSVQAWFHWHTKVADTYGSVKHDMWIYNWPFPHLSVTTGSTKEERQIAQGNLCMQKAIKFWYCLKFKKGYRYYNEKNYLLFTKRKLTFYFFGYFKSMSHTKVILILVFKMWTKNKMIWLIILTILCSFKVETAESKS